MQPRRGLSWKNDRLDQDGDDDDNNGAAWLYRDRNSGEKLPSLSLSLTLSSIFIRSVSSLSLSFSLSLSQLLEPTSALKNNEAREQSFPGLGRVGTLKADTSLQAPGMLGKFLHCRTSRCEER